MPNIVTTQRRHDACGHEAGHAVVAWRLGLPLSDVTVLSVGADAAVSEFDGETELNMGQLVMHLDPGGVRDDGRYRDLIAYYIGGEIGQRGNWSGKVTHDAPSAGKFAARLVPSDPDSVIAERVGYVKQLLLVDCQAQHYLLRDTLLGLPTDPNTAWHVPLAYMSEIQIRQLLGDPPPR